MIAGGCFVMAGAWPTPLTKTNRRAICRATESVSPAPLCPFGQRAHTAGDGGVALHIDADAGEDDDTLEAVNGALMAALGDETVETLAAGLRAARAEAERAYRRLAGAMLWEQMALGTSDYKLAARSQQARGTVRRALGL